MAILNLNKEYHQTRNLVKIGNPHVCRATPGETPRAGIRQSVGRDSVNTAVVGKRGSLPAPAKNSSPRKSQSRNRRLARHYFHMKREGAYLDYMQYYHDDEYGETTGILDCCHTSWSRERKGENIRYRANGCGRRFDCPLCGNYVQAQLAVDASNNMTMAMTALDVVGVGYNHYGLKLIFTIPKETSSWIDELIFGNPAEWAAEVNRLFKSVAKMVKRWYGSGAAFLMSLELTGGSYPTEPHYHVSVYVFPAVYVRGKWQVLDGYTDKLDKWRDEWTSEVNKLYQLKLENANFRYDYLRTMGQMRHWLRYMYRPVLADLWRGWGNYDGVGLEYRSMKDRRMHELYILKEDLDKAFDRARFIPKHFKRLRWGGIFSDGKRGKTMELVLGLDRVESENPDTSKSEGWERDPDVFRLVKYEPEGVLLRDTETEEVFLVPDESVDFRPDMVRTGRRVKWREPGSKRGLYEANLVLHSAEYFDELVLHRDKKMKGGFNNSACGCREVTK